MVSATRAAHNIEITTEGLQEELARLEIQRHSLERELAAVVAHLGSVQRALSALTVLMTQASDTSSPTETPETAETTETPTRTASATTVPAASQKDTRPRPPSGKQQAPRKPAARPQAEEQQAYGRLTEQILDYFAQTGDTDVRARDVAAALGRATDSGSINAVRSTLDRLVGASRIARVGRGLYRAKS
ncbi:hypothetical protein [Streptomyces tauricus]|uniref:hypothetical protein n=1 Tax=Streptomyces tauricus TaxID=68274 RepID=UPI003416B223